MSSKKAVAILSKKDADLGMPSSLFEDTDVPRVDVDVSEGENYGKGVCLLGILGLAPGIMSTSRSTQCASRRPHARHQRDLQQGATCAPRAPNIRRVRRCRRAKLGNSANSVLALCSWSPAAPQNQLGLEVSEFSSWSLSEVASLPKPSSPKSIIRSLAAV